MPAQSGDNGKVTMAVLGTKLDALQVGQDKLSSRVEAVCAAYDTRIGNLETEQGVLAERVIGIKEDVDALKGWEQGFKLWNGINSLLAGIASALGIMK